MTRTRPLSVFGFEFRVKFFVYNIFSLAHNQTGG